MAKDPDWEWKAEITKLVAEVNVNQHNLSKKLDEYIASSEKRSDRLEKTVFGLNGTPGLTEQVRVHRGKWVAATTFVTMVVSAAVNAAFYHLSR